VSIVVLSRSDVESLVDLDALRAAVAEAMREVSTGQVSMPARIAATVPDRGLVAAMPAYLPGAGLAVKLVSLFPGNTDLPTHQALVVVFSPETGQPVALLDGTSITVARTAAGSALSAQLLARPDAQTLAILGTGEQARAHAHALIRVRPIRTVLVAGRTPDRAAAVATELAAALRPTVAVQVAPSFADACRAADIVCATTHSPDPIVHREFLRTGTHVISVGYNTAGREVDSATVASSIVVVESRDAVLGAPPAGANDLRVPIEEGLIGPDHIHAEIGELVAGTRPGRTSPDQITLYKSVGIAAQDAAAAALVLAAARARGVGRTIDL
jgi:ornithine cyclodeaminase